jgi:hypothetical protein
MEVMSWFNQQLSQFVSDQPQQQLANSTTKTTNALNVRLEAT